MKGESIDKKNKGGDRIKLLLCAILFMLHFMKVLIGKVMVVYGWKSQGNVQWVSETKREECDLSEIWISIKCSKSDTISSLASNPTVGNVIDKQVEMEATCSLGETSEITSAEEVCKERAATPEVGEKYMETKRAYNDFINANKTDDLSGSQPTKGNIRGGLSTIEKKAFGNFRRTERSPGKSGSRNLPSLPVVRPFSLWIPLPPLPKQSYGGLYPDVAKTQAIPKTISIVAKTCLPGPDIIHKPCQPNNLKTAICCDRFFVAS